ncbi:MAG: hypothetical protein R3D02_05540 [Hyphomicrobiales bacterium]
MADLLARLGRALFRKHGLEIGAEPHRIGKTRRGLVRQAGDGIVDALPGLRLVHQFKDIDAAGKAGNAGEQRRHRLGVETAHGGLVVEAEIVVGVPAAKPARHPPGALRGNAERPQKRRFAIDLANDDHRRNLLAPADMAIPGGKKVEPLIGGHDRLVLERAPDLLRPGNVGDVAKADRFGLDGLCWLHRHGAFCGGRHGMSPLLPAVAGCPVLRPIKGASRFRCPPLFLAAIPRRSYAAPHNKSGGDGGSPDGQRKIKIPRP